MPQDTLQDRPISIDEFEEQRRQYYGIPKGLAASLRQQESGGQHYDKAGGVLTSPKQAKGRYQVLKSTAAQYGLNADDPFENIEAGFRYMADLHKKVDAKVTDPGERWASVVAGYHSGEGGLNKVNKTGNMPGTNDGMIQTQDYVSSIMKRWQEHDAREQGQPATSAQAQGPAPEAAPIVAARPLTRPAKPGPIRNPQRGPIAPTANPFATNQGATGFQEQAQKAYERTQGLGQGRPQGLAEAANQFKQAALKGFARIPQGISESLQMPVSDGERRLAQTLGPSATEDIKRREGGLRRTISQATEPVVKKIEQAYPVDPNDQSWLTQKIPAGAGGLVPMIASSILGRGLGARSSATSALSGAAQSAGEVSERLNKAGIEGPQRHRSAALATATGATEALGLGRALDKIGAKRAIMGRLGNVAEDVAQEYGQEYLGDVNAKLVGQYDKNASLSPISSNKLEAAALGGILGGAMQGAGAGIARAIDARDVRQVKREPQRPMTVVPSGLGHPGELQNGPARTKALQAQPAPKRKTVYYRTEDGPQSIELDEDLAAQLRGAIDQQRGDSARQSIIDAQQRRDVARATDYFRKSRLDGEPTPRDAEPSRGATHRGLVPIQGTPRVVGTPQPSGPAQYSVRPNAQQTRITKIPQGAEYALLSADPDSPVARTGPKFAPAAEAPAQATPAPTLPPDNLNGIRILQQGERHQNSRNSRVATLTMANPDGSVRVVRASVPKGISDGQAKKIILGAEKAQAKAAAQPTTEPLAPEAPAQVNPRQAARNENIQKAHEDSIAARTQAEAAMREGRYDEAIHALAVEAEALRALQKQIPNKSRGGRVRRVEAGERLTQIQQEMKAAKIAQRQAVKAENAPTADLTGPLVPDAPRTAPIAAEVARPVAPTARLGALPEQPAPAQGARETIPPDVRPQAGIAQKRERIQYNTRDDGPQSIELDADLAARWREEDAAVDRARKWGGSSGMNRSFERKKAREHIAEIQKDRDARRNVDLLKKVEVDSREDRVVRLNDDLAKEWAAAKNRNRQSMERQLHLLWEEGGNNRQASRIRGIYNKQWTETRDSIERRQADRDAQSGWKEAPIAPGKERIRYVEGKERRAREVDLDKDLAAKWKEQEADARGNRSLAKGYDRLGQRKAILDEQARRDRLGEITDEPTNRLRNADYPGGEVPRTAGLRPEGQPVEAPQKQTLPGNADDLIAFTKSDVIEPVSGATQRGGDYYNQIFKTLPDNELVKYIQWAKGPDGTRYASRFLASDAAAELRSRGVPVDEIEWQERTLTPNAEDAPTGPLTNSTNRLPGAEYAGGEVRTYQQPQAEGQPVDVSRRPPAPQRPVGPRSIKSGPQGQYGPTTMTEDFPKSRRALRFEGERVSERVKEFPNGGYGDTTNNAFKSYAGNLEHGHDSFFHDPEIKGALGLTRDAEQGDIKAALNREFGRLFGIQSGEISLTHVSPEMWRNWAKMKDLSPEARAKLETAIERGRQRSIARFWEDQATKAEKRENAKKTTNPPDSSPPRPVPADAGSTPKAPSDYQRLRDANAKAIAALNSVSAADAATPGGKRKFDAAADRLRKSAKQMGVDPSHADAIITDAMNAQMEVAHRADADARPVEATQDKAESKPPLTGVPLGLAQTLANARKADLNRKSVEISGVRYALEEIDARRAEDLREANAYIEKAKEQARKNNWEWDEVESLAKKQLGLDDNWHTPEEAAEYARLEEIHNRQIEERRKLGMLPEQVEARQKQFEEDDRQRAIDRAAAKKVAEDREAVERAKEAQQRKDDDRRVREQIADKAVGRVKTVLDKYDAEQANAQRDRLLADFDEAFNGKTKKARESASNSLSVRLDVPTHILPLVQERVKAMAPRPAEATPAQDAPPRAVSEAEAAPIATEPAPAPKAKRTRKAKPAPEAAPPAAPTPEPAATPAAKSAGKIDGKDVTADEMAVYDAMAKAEPRFADNAAASFSRARQESALSKEAFDKAAISLAEKEILALHQHDFPQSLSPEGRAYLVQGNGQESVAGSLRNPRAAVERAVDAGMAPPEGSTPVSAEPVAPARKPRVKSSLGKLDREESTGHIEGFGFGALQGLGKYFRRDTPPPQGADLDGWMDKMGNSIHDSMDDASVAAFDRIVNQAADAAEAGDKAAWNKYRRQAEAMVQAQPERDIRKRDYFTSPLSNLNYKGTYERLAGEMGKEISETIREAQVAIDRGGDRAEILKQLRKDAREYEQALRYNNLPGLAKMLRKHIDYISDAGDPWSQTAQTLRSLQYNLKLRFNPRSTAVNLLQPLQTLWPHMTTRDFIRVTNEARKPETKARLDKILGEETALGVEDAKASRKYDLFGRASAFNRRVGYLAGEMFADRLGMTGDAKDRLARDWGKKVEFDTGKYDAPPIFRGNAASVLLQFKAFQVKNIERLVADAMSAPHGSTTGKVARLGKTIAAQVALGGVRSIPLSGTVGAIVAIGMAANALKKAGVDDDTADKMAEAAYYGAPSLLGQDFSGSVGILDAPFGKTAEEKAVNFLGGPTLSTGIKLGKEVANIYEAKDSSVSSASEKRENAALRIGKAITPYTKTAQSLYAAGAGLAGKRKGYTPDLPIGGKDTPMTAGESVGYGLMGTPVRQTKYYDEQEMPDWQKRLLGKPTGKAGKGRAIKRPTMPKPKPPKGFGEL